MATFLSLDVCDVEKSSMFFAEMVANKKYKFLTCQNVFLVVFRTPSMPHLLLPKKCEWHRKIGRDHCFFFSHFFFFFLFTFYCFLVSFFSIFLASVFLVIRLKNLQNKKIKTIAAKKKIEIGRLKKLFFLT